MRFVKGPLGVVAIEVDDKDNRDLSFEYLHERGWNLALLEQIFPDRRKNEDFSKNQAV